MRDELTFERGILLCKIIYQSAIKQTLKGIIEQDQNFLQNPQDIK